MSKKWLTRLTRIASGNFGATKEEGDFSLVTSLTKFERFFHFWVLVGRSFVRNRCPIRASALSFTTVLAMIPILAVGMSLTSIFLKEKGKEHLRQLIVAFVDNVVPSASSLPPPGLSLETDPTAGFTNDFAPLQFDSTNFLATVATEAPLLGEAETLLATLAATNAPAATNSSETVTRAEESRVKASMSETTADYIYQFVENTYSATLGVTGMIFLLLTAILTLTRVEETFNDIWGVAQGRDWWARITNYFFTITIVPVLLVAALGLANGPNFEKTREVIAIVPFLEPLISTYLPLILICFTFTMFYKLVPNTKVDFSAALAGGCLAGASWFFYNQIVVKLASSAVGASAIYGGLFMIPLLMGGLYVVWLTVLFGAQVAYAFQNRAAYLQDRLAENVNQRGREFVALRLMTFIGQRFHRGLSPATIREISSELGIPSRLVQQVLRTLLLAGLVVEVAGEESAYSPARPLDAINCHHILLALRATNGQEPATRDEPVRVEVLGEFARIQTAEREAASSVTMLALVNRAQARLKLGPPGVTPKDIEMMSPAAVVAPVVLTAPASVSETPKVEFVEAETTPTQDAAVDLDDLARRAEEELNAKKSTGGAKPASSASISGSSPTVPTNEDESFPL